MSMRILFVGRYRDPTMDRKVALMAAQPDISILQVKPRLWADVLGTTEQVGGGVAWQQVTLPMLGQAKDPHRAVYRSLFARLRAFQPDVVHVEEEPDSLAALQLAAARAVWWRRARLVLYSWQNVDRRMAPHVRVVQSVSLAAADAVLCASREAEALLRAKGYRRPVEVIPAVGVDTSTFKPMPGVRRRLSSFQVGYVGRLVPEKGVDLLIRALAALPAEAKLVLIGAGPAELGLRELAGQLGVAERVTFEGPMAPREVSQRLPLLDALALPSRTTPVWKEQFGRVLAEAMACGVPVVGSDSGAIPGVVGDAGLVFPEGDVAGLASAIRRLMGSPGLRAELAARGIARVQAEFSQEVLASRTLRFCRRLLGAPHDYA